MYIAAILGVNLARAIHRPPQPVENPALQAVPNRNIERHPQREDVRAGADALDFAQRHQQHPLAAEADDLGPQRIALGIAQNAQLA